MTVATTGMGAAIGDLLAGTVKDHCLVHRRQAGDRIDFVVKVLRPAEGLSGVEELAGFRIERPEHGVLAGHADQRAHLVCGDLRIGREHPLRVRIRMHRRVDDHHLERAFLVPVVLRQELSAPHDLAGFRPHRPAGIGPGQGGILAGDPALVIRRRTDPGRAVLHQIQHRVVDDLAPHARAPAALESRPAPCLVARFARTRNHLVAPQLLAGRDVVPGDIATERRVLTAAPCDQNTVGNDRAAGVGHVAVAAAKRLPHHLAGSGIERDDRIVRGDREDLVAVEGEAALGTGIIVADEPRPLASCGELATIFPDPAAGRRASRATMASFGLIRYMIPLWMSGDVAARPPVVGICRAQTSWRLLMFSRLI